MRGILIAMMTAFGIASAAAEGFPARPMRLVVPFPAGSSTDIIARVVGERVAAKLGQQVIIDNKPGADGAVAGVEVRRAAPDGYTVMLASNSAMSGMPAMRAIPPYDVMADFSPITIVGRYAFFVFVHKDLPATTLKELVAYMKANPGKVAYGSGNTTGRLSIAAIAAAHGLEATHVPYRGEPPAMTDLVTGRIQVMVATHGTGGSHARDGTIRPLAVILQQRSPLMPDVPTIVEAGFPEVDIAGWAGLFGPANMPREIVTLLNKSYSDAMSEPAVKQRMAEMDVVLTPSTPEKLATFTERQLEAHRKIVGKAGIERQ